MADGGYAVQNASLSMNGNGDFVVGWNEATGNRPVKVRVFNASGVATRTETVYDNASHTGNKVTSVALDDAGRIPVAWSGEGPATPSACSPRSMGSVPVRPRPSRR
jgi:hypothetical protein